MPIESTIPFRRSVTTTAALSLLASFALLLGCTEDSNSDGGPPASTTGPVGTETTSATTTTTTPVIPPTGPTGPIVGPTGAPTGPTGATTGPTGATTGPTGTPTDPTATSEGTADTGPTDETSGVTSALTSEGETSAPAGEFTLTAPWTAKDTCTPAAKDTCDNIPVENRADFIGGGNGMPTITWTAGPEGTQGYAVVFQDLSNPDDVTQPRSVHWAMWGIPSEVLTIGAGAIPEGATQAAWVGNGWFGSGNCNNVYELIVYALSGPLTLQGGAQYTAVRDQLEADDGTLVLARDYARVTPQAPCGN